MQPDAQDQSEPKSRACGCNDHEVGMQAPSAHQSGRHLRSEDLDQACRGEQKAKQPRRRMEHTGIDERRGRDIREAVDRLAHREGDEEGGHAQLDPFGAAPQVVGDTRKGREVEVYGQRAERRQHAEQ